MSTPNLGANINPDLIKDQNILFATAPNYMKNVNPEAFDLMPDFDEDTAWLTSASIGRGLDIIYPVDGGDPLFAVELLQERYD
ncbi:hypothetical protein [Rhizobium rhizogenes]|uniref:hypothetical protein n=1 Tax=Rhizobium rhizogenes TaxID=359 RepID=UPI001571B902|nr:hypothetical protein [Rhizobium rhizogenes]NTH18472.1 hypothetical protein [Rhizobium rhizogenes]NTH31446.1 hypothetical protein [Rhizobium rhizogenes]